MKAEVLIPDGASASGQALAKELGHAGFGVTHCYQPGATGIACSAERGRSCPLESAGIDAVIVPASGRHPAGLADGARCALRRRIPVVLPTSTPGTFRRWGSTGGQRQDAATALGEAVGDPLPVHSRAATRLFRELLERHHFGPAGAVVKVWRRGGRLAMTASTPAPLPLELARIVAIRIPPEVRKVDPWAGGIDFSITPAPVT